MLPEAYQAPIAYVLLAGGTIACFAGYRLFRLVLGLYGFLFGALIASSLMGPANPNAQLLAALGGGLFGALVLVVGYFVGVALVGAGLGVLVAHSVYSTLAREPHAVVIIIFALVGAFGAMLLQRYVIIVATAFGGAWTMIVAAAAIMAGRSAVATGPHVWILYPLDPAQHARWVPIAWIILGILGTVLQFVMTVNLKKKKK